MAVDNYIFGLDENVTRTPVSYKNRYGITLSADVYRSRDFDASQEHPAIIVGAPYGGVKEQGPGIYAQTMAKRGFVALAFDPSFNGYSGGEPRHASSPDFFIEDFHAAVDYLGTRDYVNRDRIGVIGMCGSGAFSLAATKVDTRIKAVATVVMYDHHRVYSRGFNDALTDQQRTAVLDSLAAQRYADFENGIPALETPRPAPIGFDENTDPIGVEFGEFYSAPRGYHHNSITQFTATSRLAFMNFPYAQNLMWISPGPSSSSPANTPTPATSARTRTRPPPSPRNSTSSPAPATSTSTTRPAPSPSTRSTSSSPSTSPDQEMIRRRRRRYTHSK